ncbi:MAG: V-type ATPase subunit [Spirochaetales bacterium]|nr:V-type ATPase subunit [Spirochaetales bacterium]
MGLAVSKYGFINAKLRARLSKLLSEDFFDSLARAHSLVDVMQLLKNTAYVLLDETYTKTGDLKYTELELFRQEVRLFQEIEQYTKDEVLNLCKALSMRYEVDTLKQTVRLWFDRVFRERSIEDAIGYLYRETIHHDLRIDEILTARDLEQIAEILSATPYGKALTQAIPRITAKGSLFTFEIALDKLYYGNLFAAINDLEASDKKIAERLIGVEIDLANINWIIRFKSMYNLSLDEALQYTLPYGFSINREAMASAYSHDKIGEVFESLIKKHDGFTAMLKDQGGDSHSRLVLIERILEHLMMKEVQRVLVGNPFTVGIILSYFILRKIELHKVMMILNAKKYNINPEEIKNRL